MSQNPTATPVKVIAQVRQTSDLEVNYAYSIPQGTEQLVVPANTLAADTLVLQGFNSTVNIEFYGHQGTPWGGGTPLIGVLSRSGHTAAIYCRVDPAAATNGDVRVSQTRAVAKTERF